MGAAATRRVRTPLFVEVRDEVLSTLGDRYAPGDRLPSEPELASEYGVSRPTIRDVLRSLEGDGLVRRIHGVGTFVTQARPTISSRFDVDLGVTEAVAAANQRLGVEVLRTSVERAPLSIAERLEIAPASSLLWIERLIRVNDVPAAHVIDTIPMSVVGTARYAGQSVYQFLEGSCDVELIGGDAEVTAINADVELATALGIPVGAAVIRMDQVERSSSQRPVLYSSERYVPAVFNLSVRRVRHGDRVDRA